jgi:peptidoglycan/xylan/chitin deacetylase (PgdA/CDA1 family)
LPVVSYGITDSAYQIRLFNNIITAFSRNSVPAVGFVNESKMYKNGELQNWQADMLNSWLKSGLDLGNHTFSHPDYNKVTFKQFSNNVIKGERISRKLLTANGKTLKYFRHPYLHVGNTKLKADSLSEFLKSRGYVVAPVTIDNEDYLFALAFKRAKDKGDDNLAGQIGKDYVSYMEQKLRYYEAQAGKLFGRDICQILLIHASLLNSEYLDSLIDMFKRSGYKFVSMDEALKDSAYKTEITVYGNWGISWIDKWAMSQGKERDFFKGDIDTPDYIKDLSK